jgi:hypothetical protein
VTGESLASSKSSEYEKIPEPIIGYVRECIQSSSSQMGEYEEESVPVLNSGDEAGEVTGESLASSKSLEYEKIPEPIIGFNHWLSPRNVRECIYKVQAVKWVSMKRRVCQY